MPLEPGRARAPKPPTSSDLAACGHHPCRYGADHAGVCANSNNNILALWGERLEYSLCRNLEWQTCAALGRLPGQGGVGMRFSYAPGNLDVYDGGTGKMLGDCRGWKPPYAAKACGAVGAQHTDAYSTDDIYFLEVCIFSFICDNGEELFGLQPGDFYVCQFNGAKFDELADLLIQPPTPTTGEIPGKTGENRGVPVF